MSDELIPPVVISDDGELDGVRRLLDELSIAYSNSWGDETHPGTVLVSTPRYALSGDPGSGGSERQAHNFHIVVAEKVSRQLHRQLQRAGCDFVVHDSVHPGALRLLILHALYSGPEKRRKARVAMSASVKVRARFWSRTATLLQLSEGGCRLASRRRFERGERITVVLPRDLTSEANVSLEGRVVGVDQDGATDPGEHCVSVAFRPPDSEARQSLKAVMSKHAVGAGALRTRPALSRSPNESPRSETRSCSSQAAGQAGPHAGGAVDRRRSPRGVYQRSVLASGGGRARAVLGRDLSTGGLRVGPDPTLLLGEELKLAIYGRADQKPALVKAVVERDDGDDGCVLLFRDPSQRVIEQLEKIVELLPSVLSSKAGATPPPDLVISEIIEDS